MENIKILNYPTKIALMLTWLLAIIKTIFLFSVNSGDALITLATSKSFKYGFFYYGPMGPRWSTTSHLQALIFAPVYIFNQDPPILIFKIINLVIFLAAGFFIYKCAKELTKNSDVSLIGATVWFTNPYIWYLTAAIYDSVLIGFLVSIFVFLIISFKFDSRKDFLIFGLISGLLPLARPEAILISVAGFAYLLLCIKNKDKSIFYNFIYSALIFLVTIAPVYGYLWLVTGHLLPASVAARGGMYLGQFNIFKATKDFFSKSSLEYSSYSKIIFIVIIFSLLFIKKFYVENKRILILITLLMFAFVPSLFLSGEIRYIMPIIPLFSMLASVLFLIFYNGWLKNFKHSHFFVISLIVLWIIYTMILSLILYKKPMFYEKNIIFEKDAADIINKAALKNDKVLAYESQIQYFLQSPIISLDGIIGGEILPYFNNKSNLRDFFEKYKPKYIIVSRAFQYRQEYRNTLLHNLYLFDLNNKVGSIYQSDSIKFLKIAQNNISDVPGFNQWHSIYYIQY